MYFRWDSSLSTCATCLLIIRTNLTPWITGSRQISSTELWKNQIRINKNKNIYTNAYDLIPRNTDSLTSFWVMNRPSRHIYVSWGNNGSKRCVCVGGMGSSKCTVYTSIYPWCCRVYMHNIIQCTLYTCCRVYI